MIEEALCLGPEQRMSLVVRADPRFWVYANLNNIVSHALEL